MSLCFVLLMVIQSPSLIVLRALRCRTGTGAILASGFGTHSFICTTPPLSLSPVGFQCRDTYRVSTRQLDCSGHKYCLQREKRSEHVAIIRGSLIPSETPGDENPVCQTLKVRLWTGDQRSVHNRIRCSITDVISTFMLFFVISSVWMETVPDCCASLVLLVNRSSIWTSVIIL